MLSIIGCGNTNRSDDGAGVYVAQRLAGYLSAGPRADVRVFDAGTAGMEVMFQARGSKSLIVVDASSSGSEPGSIFEVPGEILESVPEPNFSLHGFRWDHAIYAGRKIFRDDFPSDVTVYLIEAGDLALGLELTEAVRSAADRVVQKIVDRLEQRITPVKNMVRIFNGSLYMDFELYNLFFSGIESVALLPETGGFFIMPVHNQASGGRLLKKRNSAGDRVITATDFFLDCGIAHGSEQNCRTRWDQKMTALFVGVNTDVPADPSGGP